MTTQLTKGIGQTAEVLAIRELADRELREYCTAGTVSHGVNRPLVEALGRTGLLRRVFPSEGSIPTNAVELCRLREAIASEVTEAEAALALQGLGGYPISQAGRPAVVGRWLPPVSTGRAVAAFALTEPDAGSDAAAIACRAERDGDGFRLTGTKKWISNAPDADVYTLFARTTLDAGARGVTAFVVEGDANGLSGSSLDLIAPHPIGVLELDGVFVPDDHVLGEVDRGFRVAMGTLDLFRPSVGALAVGMAQAALETSIEHADKREAFGGPLRDLQAVAHQLADMATSVFAARLAVYEAAAAYDRGDAGVTRLSAMSKLFATEAAQAVVDSAVQIHGAQALEIRHPLALLYREVRAPRIYEGTSEIQRNIIARGLYR